MVRTHLNNLVRNSLVECRIADSSQLEGIALCLRDLLIELSPGDGREHGLEGLVEATARIAVGGVGCDHLIGSDELVAEVGVDMALDHGLLGLNLEVLDGAVDVDRLLDVARGDDDLEDLAFLTLSISWRTTPRLSKVGPSRYTR